MAKIANATFQEFKAVQGEIIDRIQGLKSFEEAAQTYTATIYKHFKDSIVLVRYFATVPYEELPAQNKNFVDRLASSKSVSDLIHPQTLILSLLGSSGVEGNWNDRKKSQGHVGIPLISSKFIKEIPMMARLLKQLGAGLDWIDSSDTKIVEKTMGLMSGMFFVPEAATEVDNHGRKIIAAQDFVKSHNVRAVFGFGGGYLGTKTMVVTIIFLREAIEKKQTEFLASAMSRFRTVTAHLVKEKIFV